MDARLHRTALRFGTHIALIALLAFPLSRSAADEGVPACHVGVYRLSDGGVVDIAQANNRSTLSYAMLDGRFGVLAPRADGRWDSLQGWTGERSDVDISFGSCGRRIIRVDGRKGQAVPLQVHETTFASRNAQLVGRLVLPKGRNGVPIIVYGHGAEHHSALDHNFQQRIYPASGVGVFVFDKRGTGRSGSEYTQDFDTLADDVVAAVQETRRLAGSRVSRLGLSGVSQAGWVLPLAATRTEVDFVIVNSGIAGRLTDEDHNETMRDLAASGWGADVLSKAREITDATAAVMGSRGASGIGTLRAVVAKYRHEPWLDDAKGMYTGEAIRNTIGKTETELQELAASIDWDQVPPWGYDAVATLKALRTPLLWLIAADDTQGPGPETPRNLLALKRAGKPVTIVRFPGTEHGVLEYRTASGKEAAVRYGEGSLMIELGFARNGAIERRYGNAEILW